MIGFFDSGFGGLTVLRHVVRELPEYDYLYLGDNARVPYGGRSEWIIYEFTKQAVDYLFQQGCCLIIIACNTASANALRRIQQEYLPAFFPDRRVLGVIRPSVEMLADITASRKVGILATESVVRSGAYVKEVEKLDPSIRVFQKACPLLVPIIEEGEQDWVGTKMIVSRYADQLFSQDGGMDTVLLACTHYPILIETFRRHVPPGVAVIEQGPIVAEKLKDYLFRHPEICRKIGREKQRLFLTTDKSDKFDGLANTFYGESVHAQLIPLESLCA